MAKGFFTQGVSLLTDGQTTIEQIKSVLQENGFEIVKQTPSREDWSFGGPTVIVPFLPEVNGYVAVDVVNQPWPDSMGDPKSDAMTFGAWSMGHFGPYAFPGSLARARQHAWGWELGRTVPEGHRGFIRIRLSYVFGGNRNTPVLPKGYDPLTEMMFLSRAALALLSVPSAICYFNPNGETVYDLATFRTIWDGCKTENKIPLSLWMNVRNFNIDEHTGLMDTVGNSQLDIGDIEAVFPRLKYHPREISYYLRNVTHYLLESGSQIQTGEDIDGPGECNLSWTTELLEEGVVTPPRRVLRLYPKANVKEIQRALASISRSPT